MSPERATTDEKKREVIERIYKAWCELPELRLGQLLFLIVSNHLIAQRPGPESLREAHRAALEGASSASSRETARHLFNIEDLALADHAEKFR